MLAMPFSRLLYLLLGHKNFILLKNKLTAEIGERVQRLISKMIWCFALNIIHILNYRQILPAKSKPFEITVTMQWVPI